MGNFRGQADPPRNFNVGVAYRNVEMQAGNEIKQNYYSQKPPFLELNDFLPHENYSLYGSVHEPHFGYSYYKLSSVN